MGEPLAAGPRSGVTGAPDHARPETGARLYASPAQFALVSAQLVLLLAVIWAFRIEAERGLVQLSPLVFGGFAVHAWLPLRARPPFFVLLTVTAALLLLGPVHGSLLVAMVLGILGICHLPIPLRARAGVVIVVAVALAAALVVQWGGGWSTVVIPMLGAIFMFRLVLYLYDLGGERSPATPWQRLSYFLMLPNVFFPLFPVVDYRTWLRTHYRGDAGAIYQKGLNWILRGLSHLILYRIVYHLLPRVDDLGGPVGVLVAGAMTYGLYLRLSGLFHLITGMLCLFGYDLPTTHRKYFLASSFNDLWRRANIYFKDFMMTTVFYPIVLKTRRWGLARSMGFSALVVGVTSWQLHAYQWFWLVGVYPLSGTDAFFWLTLGAGMTVNTVWETVRGRKRQLGKEAWTARDALARSVRTVAFFLFLSQMWLVWDRGSFRDWWFRASKITEGGVAEWMLVLAILAAAVLALTASQWIATRSWMSRRLERPSLERLALGTATVALAILAIGTPRVHEALGDYPTRVVRKAKSTELNRIDAERQVRGYYETLTRAVRFTTPLWDVQGARRAPKEWLGEQPVRERSDMLLQELIPGLNGFYKGAALSTNRWGMRDRDYTLEKPAGTFRIALLGGSIPVGAGVADGRTFEALVEEELNRSPEGVSYEILNFAVPNSAPHQMSVVARTQAMRFQPDAVFYVAHLNEARRVTARLWGAVRGRRTIGDPVILDAIRRSGVRPDMTVDEFQSVLAPYAGPLLRHSYEGMVEAARDGGAVPVWVFVPRVKGENDPHEVRREAELARRVGFRVLSLADVYDGYASSDLWIAPWDDHPNELGHRLIARALLEEIRADPTLLDRPPVPDGGVN